MKYFILLLFHLSWSVLFSQDLYDSKLPIPDSTFFNKTTLNSETTIEKYIKNYFSGGDDIKVLDSTSWDTDGQYRICHTITEYDRVAIENYNCEMFSTFNFIFKGYSKSEVVRVMKLLFIDTEQDIWEGDDFGPIEEGVGCFLSITQKPSRIIVSYGCGC